MMVYAYFDKYRFTPRQRTLTKYALLSIWWLNFAYGNISRRAEQLLAVQVLLVRSSRHPRADHRSASSLPASSWSPTRCSGRTTRSAARGRASTWWCRSWRSTSGGYRMTRQYEFYFLLTPFFHSLQYLAFVYKMEDTRLRGLQHPRDPRNDRRRRASCWPVGWPSSSCRTRWTLCSARSTRGRCSSSSPRRCCSSTSTTTSSTTSSGDSGILKSRNTCCVNSRPVLRRRTALRTARVPRTREGFMLDRTALFAFVFVFAISGLAAAQDWADDQNIQDGFKVAFPGQPKVTDTTWTTEYGYKAPAHVYSAERGKERYTLTVVDYNAIEAQGIERRKGCPPGAEPCVGSDISGPGYWKHDIRGAMIYAAKKYLQRDVKMTNYTWQHQDLIEGAELQLTSNADQSRTFASSPCTRTSYTSLDGTVPKGYPQPGLFQQSMGFVDKDGRGIRYRTMHRRDLRAERSPDALVRRRRRSAGPGPGRRRTPWRRRRQRAAAALDQITHARGRAARTPRPRS